MSARTVSRRKPVVRPQRTSEFPFTKADLQKISESSNEPEWYAERRIKAWEVYQDLPMPTTSDEPWRRTDIRPMPSDKVALVPADDVPIDKDLLQPLVSDARDLLVLRPGHDAQREIGVETDGVIFVDWATAIRDHGAILKEHLGKVVPDGEGKFSALASAFAQYGALLYVPPGVEVHQPLHSIMWAAGRNAAFFSRVLIIIGEGSSATYVHEAASPTEPKGETIHAGIVEIRIGAGGSLTFVEVQNLGQHVWNFSHERAEIGRDASLDWVYGSVGSHLTKIFAEMNLLGQGARGRMSGFYFTDGRQHLDHDTQQNHRAPNTTSDLLFKGALIEKSRSVWQGMIYVAPGAQKVDGYQANRNLVLSKNARADSIPGLEILADDVRCTHGATVGQLQEEPIFYLMSRGLPRREAERLLIDGFFAPIMERIPFEGVRSRFKKMINSKLESPAK